MSARRKLYTKHFVEDLAYWRQTNQRICEKIEKLIEESAQDPFKGIGKPEPLRHQLSGCWSRRIDREHRLVYQVTSDTITFLQCRKHY